MKLPENFIQELYDEVPISIKFSLIRLLSNSEFINILFFSRSDRFIQLY